MMKTRFLYIFIALITLASCKKQETTENQSVYNSIEVQSHQNSLATMMTATWCAPCGSWGHTVFREALSGANGIDIDRVSFVAYHPSTSDPLYNEYADKIADFFDKPAYPNFQESIDNQTINSYNWINKIKLTQEKELECAIGAIKTFEGDKVRIFSKIEQQSQINTPLNVAVWVVQKEVIAKQNVGGRLKDDFKHEHVFEDIANGMDPWGEQLQFSGNSPSLNEFEYTISPDLDRDNLLFVITVFEMKNGQPSRVVNTYQL